LLPVHQGLLVLIGRLPIWLKATKLNHTAKKNRDIMWVNLLVNANAPHTKIIVTPRTNSKSNMLWWYSLHEVQIFIPVALTINGNIKLSLFIVSRHLLTRFACGKLKNQYRGFEDVKTDIGHYTSHTGFY